VIEALESSGDQFVVAVQWHPESLTDRDPRMHRLLTGFVQAAAR
jgi:putative glutamine amidotransferase